MPAIDILGGKAVRLHKGEYDSATVYGDEPAEVAARWIEGGAEVLHVVDLDGAREGRCVNIDRVAEIASSSSGVVVQAGGGVRGLDTVESLIEAGVDRIVIGTAAIRDPAFLAEAIGAVGPERIVVAVDSRDGEVSLEGWTEGSGVPATEAVARLGDSGARRFLFTSIETDGTMEGPDIAALGQVADATPWPVIASGGVGTLGDLRALAEGSPPNVEGVIVGKALYESRFTVREAIEAARG